MIYEMDARIPNASTAWQLWHTDRFDRESSPSVRSSGENILHGLHELWRYTLNEGIVDNGSASFSSFHLTWGNTPSARIDVDVKPFENASLMKLRQWINGTAQNQEESQGVARHDQEPRNSVLSRVAQLHYELLQRSHRWDATAIHLSAESKELLERIELLTNPEELYVEIGKPPNI